MDLADRDGLRTPMQWNDSPHGGFTSGASATIPANEHATWGFERLNVASAVDAPDSLFDRVAGMLRIRLEHQAFGRGSVEFLETRSPSILALRRQCPGDAVLFVANLSGAPQFTGVVLPRGAARVFPRPAPDRFVTTTLAELELAPYEWGWWTVPGTWAGALAPATSAGQRCRG